MPSLVPTPIDAPAAQPVAPDQSAPADAAAPAALASQDPHAQFMNALLNSPLVKSIQDGQIPAVYAPSSIFGDHSATAINLLETGLPKIGLGFVNLPHSDINVMFNPHHLTHEQVIEAAKNGTLDKIAVSGLALQQQGQQGQTDPNAAPADGAMPSPDGSTPPDASQAAPAPQVAVPAPSAALQVQRADSSNPLPPTKRALPSQGLVNGLVKRAV